MSFLRSFLRPDPNSARISSRLSTSTWTLRTTPTMENASRRCFTDYNRNPYVNATGGGLGRLVVDEPEPEPAAKSTPAWRPIYKDKPVKSQVPEPKVILSAHTVRAWKRHAESHRKKVGLVPTMGALHEGHLSLIKHAAEQNDEIIVSVFVNPAQFGPTEDLATYPQTWKEDEKKIRQLNKELHAAGSRGLVTAIFKPKVGTMYPGVKENEPLPLDMSYVTVNPSLTGVLEGAARPTFFRGVTTVVMKLFWLIQPDQAYFGQKDIQQLVVINRMVRDFRMPITIVPVPIERDETGLALSSRNAYLGQRRREVARVLSRALRASEAALQEGKTGRDEVLDAALRVAAEELKKQRSLPPNLRALFEVEYISLAGHHNLVEVQDVRTAKRVILSGTIKMLPLEETSEEDGELLGLGGDKKPVRLLDNIIWSSSRSHEIEDLEEEDEQENKEPDDGDGDVRQV